MFFNNLLNNYFSWNFDNLIFCQSPYNLSILLDDNLDWKFQNAINFLFFLDNYLLFDDHFFHDYSFALNDDWNFDRHKVLVDDLVGEDYWH